MDKGNLNEQEALKLVGEIEGEFYSKNEETLENDFITGTPDHYQKKLIDTKCSWDIWTFWKSKLSKEYEWQLKGYCWLTGKSESDLWYCLTDTPEDLVYDEKRKLQYVMKVIDPEKDENYLIAEKQLYINHHFKDIPVKARGRKFDVILYAEDKSKMIARIKKAREYLNGLNEHYENLIK